MRKELAFLIAALATSCGRPLPTSSPEPTPITQNLSYEELSAEMKRQAGEIFFDQLTQMSRHPDLLIASLPPHLFRGQESDDLIVKTSTPWFNTEGSLGNGAQEPPLGCGFEEDGKFLILVNSNFYLFRPSYPPEASAALLYGCFNFQEAINGRFQSFLESNPDTTLAEAIRANPDWFPDSLLDAWYETARGILAPYRDTVPAEDGMLKFILDIYDDCGGDKECFREAILNPPQFNRF